MQVLSSTKTPDCDVGWEVSSYNKKKKKKTLKSKNQEASRNILFGFMVIHKHFLHNFTVNFLQHTSAIRRKQLEAENNVLNLSSPGWLLVTPKQTWLVWNNQLTNSLSSKKNQKQNKADHVCHLDPSLWAAQFPSCGGLRQSPINIVTSKVHVNSALPPFNFIGHTNRINITVENKGHSGNGAFPSRC